jgi:hypothetical protein
MDSTWEKMEAMIKSDQEDMKAKLHLAWIGRNCEKYNGKHRVVRRPMDTGPRQGTTWRLEKGN